MQDMRSTLADMADELDSVPAISSGGCGITALEIYKRLPAEVQPRILVSGAAESSCAELADNLANGRRGAAGHIFVGLTLDGKDYVYDPSGLHEGREDPTFGFRVLDGTLQDSWLQYMCDDPHRWNRSFSRSYWPDIESITSKYLGPAKRQVSAAKNDAAL